jgi:CBS domain containing-hemolysin-like protein
VRLVVSTRRAALSAFDVYRLCLISACSVAITGIALLSTDIVSPITVVPMQAMVWQMRVAADLEQHPLAFNCFILLSTLILFGRDMINIR